MKLKKTVMAILAALTLFALPLIASAQPVFPNITGLKVKGSKAAKPVFPNITGLKVNGSKVTFLTMDGIVNNLNIQRTTVNQATGKLARSDIKLKNGIESPAGNIITPDNSGHFLEFADTIVFGDFTLSLLTTDSKLLAPTGNQAFGPVLFQLVKTGVSDGFSEVIVGAAEAKLNFTNLDKRMGVLIVNQFQPSAAFKNNSTASGITTTYYDAHMAMSATQKTFQLFTTAPPAPPSVVNAGPDKTTNALFTQTGTATDLTMTFLWTMDSGPGIITFGTPTPSLIVTRIFEGFRSR